MGTVLTGRLFKTVKQAEDAAAELKANYITDDSLSVMLAGNSVPTDIDAAAKAIIAGHPGWVPPNYARIWAQHVRDGESLVLISPPYGCERQVVRILNEFKPVALDLPEPDKKPLGPTPFSDFLGARTLKDGLSFSSEPGSFMAWVFGQNRDFGENMKFVFSSAFALPLLSSNPTPLSSMFKIPLLSDEGLGDKSFGMPYLLDDAAPFSKFFNMKVVADRDLGEQSFGMPLITKDPTPLSSTLGMPTLTDGPNPK